MNVLILVDLQIDFLPGGALEVPRGDEVIPIANKLQPHFDLVVASRDWHPPNHGSFADNHEGRTPGDVITLGGLSQILWPRHCVSDSRGAEFPQDLDRQAVARHFCKGTDPRVDSYSAFFDNGHRQSTGLGDYLRLQGVTEIYLMGLATDYCLKYSALDARRLGFTCHVIEDGCRGVELHPGDVQSACEEMRRAGVLITTSDEVLQRFAKGDSTVSTVARSEYLQILKRGRWEFAQRHCGQNAVAIAALTDEGSVVLIEQYRPAVDAPVIELPAGLIGHDAEPDETAKEAARRELREETGYEAIQLRQVFAGPSSAGLTDEMVSFVIATGLTRVSAGGGVSGERIKVHHVPLAQADEWILEKARQGYLVDARLFTGLHLLMRFSRRA
jgi:nicotinamidase/pyrazinamidase